MYAPEGEDQVHWPESAPGEALYIHMPAVRRSEAGQGHGERLIEFACGAAVTARTPLVRLDTTPGSRLQAFYARLGFVADPLGPATFAGRRLVRMQKRLT